MKNLLAPIVFEIPAEAARFCMTRRCSICLGRFTTTETEGGEIVAKCFSCDQYAMEHNHMSETEAHKIERGRSIIKMDLKHDMKRASGEPNRPEKDILEELGF